jgi:hypothetical protein
MTDEEVEAMLSNFTEQDAAENKTWTRIVVENYLSKVSNIERRQQRGGLPRFANPLSPRG